MSEQREATDGMTHDQPEGTSDVHERSVAVVWNHPNAKLPRSNARVRIDAGWLNVTELVMGSGYQSERHVLKRLGHVCGARS